MALQGNRVKIVASKKYFSKNRKVAYIRYLSIDDVMGILKHDYVTRGPNNLVLTNGSKFVTVPRKGDLAHIEGMKFRIDPLLSYKGKLYMSFRSINRLFNVDLSTNLSKKLAFFQKPGPYFIGFKGDTLRSVASLMKVSVKQLIAVNPNLKEPIKTGTRIIIPTINNQQTRPNLRSPIVRIKQMDKLL